MEDAGFSAADQEGRQYAFSVGSGDDEIMLMGEKPERFELFTQKIGGLDWNLYISYPFPVYGIFQSLAFFILLLSTSILISWIVQSNRSLTLSSRTDPLTGIPNRRGFDAEIDRIVTGKKSKPFMLVAIDIDRFKSFNDLYGHDSGDLLLKSFARELSSFVGTDGYIARNGGDEFQIFLKDPTGQRIRKLEEFFQRAHVYTYGEKEYQYYISGGYALYPQQTQDIYDLYKKADIALYYTKTSIEGRLCRYREDMKEKSKMELGLNFRDFSEGMPGPFIVCRGEGDEKILFANEAAVRIFGYGTYEEMAEDTGGTLWNLVHPDDRTWMDQSIRRQQPEKDGKRLVVRFLTKDGKAKHIALYFQLIHHEYYGDIFFLWMMDEKNINCFRMNPADKGEL